MWKHTLVILFAFGGPAVALAQAQLSGKVKGTVVDAANRQPLTAVTLTLSSPVFERTVTVDGRFELTNIPAGAYRLKATSPGYAEWSQDLEVPAGDTVALDLALTVGKMPLEYMVVTPSTFSLLTKAATGGSYLDRETIRNTPHFGDDVYRALRTLPGTSSQDFSASFNVRGGEYREVQVTLDGMELINPFHLKDFTGLFSFIDPETLDGLELNTGGFAAKHGNTMSGVMEMTTLTPERTRSSASISLGNLSFRTEGVFAGGRGGYLFSGRRGYLDILLSFAEDEEEMEEQDISYYDSYGKLFYQIGERHRFSASYLLASDSFLEREMEDGAIENAEGEYDDLYLWITLTSVWNDRLSTETVLYQGQLSQDRIASGNEGLDIYDFSDRRDLDYQGVKQNWQWALGDRHFMRWGFDARTVDGAYDYRGAFENPVPIGTPEEVTFAVDLEPSGDEVGAYVTDRFQIGDRWLFELGLRYDRQTLLGESQWSPRFNTAYRLGRGRTLRLAAGVYHQAERVHDLQVPDGVDTFSKPEKATHWLVGYERRFGNGIDLRIEGYYKDLEDLRTRYENLTRSLTLYPGPSSDRVAIAAESGEVRGLEIVLKQDLGGTFSWFANYAWSRAEDRVSGKDIARPWDQEHSFKANLNYRPGRKWNFNLAWFYHTGWRTTPLELVATTGEDGQREFDIVPGEFFSDTFPAYHRLDLRVNRSVFRKIRRAFELFLDVTNLYNRKNVRGYEEIQVDFDANGQPFIVKERETWFPILPTFGLTWRF